MVHNKRNTVKRLRSATATVTATTLIIRIKAISNFITNASAHYVTKFINV